MADFTPVSIKMAKDQNLSLNPAKISGLCGRLMCCLNYEEEHYAHMRQLMPKVGSTLKYKGEEATVVECNHLIGRLRLRINKDQEDSFEFEWIDHQNSFPNRNRKPKSKSPLEDPPTPKAQKATAEVPVFCAETLGAFFREGSRFTKKKVSLSTDAVLLVISL